MSGLRRHLFKLANNATAVVDFNLFITGLPMQNIFIVALNAQLADVMGGGVVRQFVFSVETLDVFIIDFRYVADNVGQRRSVWIIAAFIAFDFDARKTVLVDSKARDLNFRQVCFHRNRSKAMGSGALFFKGGDIVVV